MFRLELPEIYILTSPFLHISKSCFFGPIASVRTNIGPGPHMCTIDEIFFRKIKFDIQLNALEKNRVQNFSEIVPKMVDQKSASANFTIKKSVTSCNSSSPCYDVINLGVVLHSLRSYVVPIIDLSDSFNNAT